MYVRSKQFLLLAGFPSPHPSIADFHPPDQQQREHRRRQDDLASVDDPSKEARIDDPAHCERVHVVTSSFSCVHA